jgi:predicted transposase/invertase (TIGR01784 family)
VRFRYNAESEEELDMLEKTNVPVIQESVQTIRKLNEDEKIRALAWECEKAERDYYSETQNAVDEGVARGRSEGILEGVARERAKVIAKMRAKGMSESEIADILGT